MAGNSQDFAGRLVAERQKEAAGDLRYFDIGTGDFFRAASQVVPAGSQSYSSARIGRAMHQELERLHATREVEMKRHMKPYERAVGACLTISGAYPVYHEQPRVVRLLENAGIEVG